MTPPASVVVHGIAHARAAAAAAAALGVPVRLRSAPGAAVYAGAAWFEELLALVRAEFPEAGVEGSLDCADAPGYALAALRRGCRLIRFSGSRRMTARIAAVAEAGGARLDDDAGPVLDLAGAADPAAACRDWLARGAERIAPARG